MIVAEKKAYQDNMRSSRSNFDGFDNRDVWEEGKKALKRKKKRRKFLRNISLATFTAAIVLIFVVFLRPDYFTFFSLPKIHRYLSKLYPDQQTTPLEDTKEATLYNDIYSGSTAYQEYLFTKDDVDKETRKMLKHRNQAETQSSRLEHIKETIKNSAGGDLLVEIQLLSGKRIFGDSATMNNNIVVVEDKKGVVIELGIEQIAAIQLKTKTGNERK